MTIGMRFWPPSVTSQFDICPVPFHLDSYRGCVYDCRYCFARDITNFSRRKRGYPFSKLEGNDAERFERWISRVESKGYDYSKAEEVAFKERIPLKVGASSDPFPPFEPEERITHGILRVLHSLDYPVEIQTKNPEGLLSYVKEFKDPNWAVAVTIISSDEGFVRTCEPHAPSVERRLRAIRELTSTYGLRVMVKIQPSIYPKIMEDLEELIPLVAKAGAWAINTEGLKVRVSMPEEEQALFREISSKVGYDLRAYYRREGIKTGSDWEMRNERRREYTDLALTLAHFHGLRYYVADNHMGRIGDGSECCGTEVLRNYRIWGRNLRTLSFESSPSHASDRFGRCLVNFSRSRRFEGRTIDEAMEILRSDAHVMISRLEREQISLFRS